VDRVGENEGALVWMVEKERIEIQVLEFVNKGRDL